LECQEVTPEQVSFPGARLIARLRRRVRRKGKPSTETVYLISSLTLEQLDALGWLRLKRGYGIIESRLHHALDVSLDEDRSRVRHANAALVLGMFRPAGSERGASGHCPSADPQNPLECAALSATIRTSQRRPRASPRVGLRQKPRFLEVGQMKRRVVSATAAVLSALDKRCVISQAGSVAPRGFVQPKKN
jgi:hypothetical protein